MRFRNQPRSGGRLCFFTSNLPNGNFTGSPRFKASAISSKTAFTTESASPRLNSLGCHADLSLPRRFGEIAFTRSRRVKMALVGWTTSLATSRLPSRRYASEHQIRLFSVTVRTTSSATPGAFGPSPSAHKISPRARESPTLILSSSQPAPFSAPSFSIPISVPPRLELTFWSERAIGQATLSVSRDLSQKTASALPLSLEFSSLPARPGRQLKNSYFPTPKFMHGFLHPQAQNGMF